MADNNVIKFRRVEKKPEKSEPPKRRAAAGLNLPANQLSLVAWAVIIGAAIVIVMVQQSGLLGS